VTDARRPRLTFAAGALVWRVRKNQLQVALVHRPRYEDWSWPKGKTELGETLAATAVREVTEETGHQIVLGIPLPRLTYRLEPGLLKEVHYWAARVATDDDAPAIRARGEIQPAPREEIDDVIWLDATDAHQRLSRREDRKPLVMLERMHARKRLATRALVVARHGRARRRLTWTGTEEARPLTEAGLVQATALIPVLSAFGVQELVSSPWRRCAETFAPYVAASGATLTLRPAITERSFRVSPNGAVTVVRDLLATHVDLAVCTHRPVLPAVMSTLARSTRHWTTGTLPHTDPYLRAGEALIAHVADAGKGPRLAAIERVLPGAAY
jgi:8-oxo-dGTP pyrophosphatase MutT (NUDIX family)/phosphohistidine phosphatase SixA